MNRIALLAVVSTAALAAPPPPQHRGRMPDLTAADQAAIKGYDLSQPKIDKLMKVGMKMRDYANTHPEVKNENIMEGKSLDESVKRMESKPELVSMMKSEGLAPRDWLLGTMALTQAAMWSEVSKRYPDQKAPDMVNLKNVDLLRSHPEIMQKWMGAWEPPGKHQH